VILLIYAGIRFVMSGGDPKQVQQARSIITYAIIGLVIVLSSLQLFPDKLLTGAKCIETLSSQVVNNSPFSQKRSFSYRF